MDRSSDIRLDPDVIESGAVSRIPLSDLYSLPVFSSDTEREARERHVEEERMLGKIRRCVFETDAAVREEEAWLEGIRSQIFKTSASAVLVRNDAAETVSQTEEFQVIAMAGVLCLVCVILWCRREKRYRPYIAEWEKKG